MQVKLGHGAGYQATPTSAIRAMYQRVSDLLGNQLPLYTFVDIGAGKGKVLREWGKCLEEDDQHQFIVGIESDGGFERALKDTGYTYVIADAITFDYAKLADRYIFWLFNPFGVEECKEWVKQLNGLDVVVVLNNIDHAWVLFEAGFEILLEGTYVQERGNTWFLVRSVNE